METGWCFECCNLIAVHLLTWSCSWHFNQLQNWPSRMERLTGSPAEAARGLQERSLDLEAPRGVVSLGTSCEGMISVRFRQWWPALPTVRVGRVCKCETSSHCRGLSVLLLLTYDSPQINIFMAIVVQRAEFFSTAFPFVNHLCGACTAFGKSRSLLSLQRLPL